MFNNLLGKFPIGVFENPNNRVKFLIRSNVVLFTFKNPRRTGFFMNNKTYNELFTKVKSNLFTPVTYFTQDPKTLKSMTNHGRRIEKIKNYYIKEYFNNIKTISISGSDPYLALPHVLAFWPDYDLIKDYYKNIPLGKVDELLWAKYVLVYNPYKLRYGKESLISIRRFNLFGLLKMTYGAEIPLIYRDGILFPIHRTMLKDLTLYKKDTTIDVIKALVKKFSDPSLKENDFVYNGLLLPLVTTYTRIPLFPYYLVMVLTDYGYVINLYKFNLKTLKYDLVLVKSIHELCELIRKGLSGKKVVVKQISKDGLKDLSKSPTDEYCFGVDKEYAYFYKTTIDGGLRIKLMKLPLKDVELITLEDKQVLRPLTIRFKNGDERHLYSQLSSINSVIEPPIIVS